MASWRHIAILLFALVAVTIAAKAKHNNVTIGSRERGDHMIQREFIKIPYRVLRVIKLRKTFPGDHRSRITQVRLLDQSRYKNSAKASIVNGGPGHNFVTVEFKSARGYGVDYVVEIYGRRR